MPTTCRVSRSLTTGSISRSFSTNNSNARSSVISGVIARTSLCIKSAARTRRGTYAALQNDVNLLQIHDAQQTAVAVDNGQNGIGRIGEVSNTSSSESIGAKHGHSVAPV